MPILAAIGLLWQAPPASAQDSLSVAARLVMRQPTGVVLRLNAANEQVTGILERVADGTVHLSDPPRSLQLSSIIDAWLQRRSTSRGGKVGAIIGSASGAALFGVTAALLTAVCSDCDDWGAGEVGVATLIGAAAGAGTGYIVGSLIGASVPRWEPLTETSAPATIRRARSAATRGPQRPECHAGRRALCGGEQRCGRWRRRILSQSVVPAHRGRRRGSTLRSGDSAVSVHTLRSSSSEVRWHSNFMNSGDDSQLGFYTFGVALSMLR